MACYDVFNGDADGLCALQQLRLEHPRDSVLITGMKRDIGLLNQVPPSAGDSITVLDISMDKNRGALLALLDAGASVFYADHHFPGDIPQHEAFDCHIDTAADTCTSLIINDLLEGTQARWAVVGAFGDNFDAQALKLGRSIGLDEDGLSLLQQLGICLNYNGYGFDLDDLLYHPAELSALMRPFADPIEFIQHDSVYSNLVEQYEGDMTQAQRAEERVVSDSGAIFYLPDESWARRIVGVMGNDLTKQHPERAHALLVEMGDGHYRVSVRAPYQKREGADELCRQFPSGGGRKGAAGINQLPESMLDRFVKAFNVQFGG